jgi:hypothetical protein
MKLSEYFENKKGYCVLSTANREGRVDSALYSRPFFEDEETVKFIMYDRLTHQNLQSNPFANFLFIEKGDNEFRGKRLYLKKFKEDTDSAAIDKLFKQKHIDPKYRPESKFIVHFKIEQVRELVWD